MISILADDLTGASDACAPIVGPSGPAQVCLTFDLDDAAGRRSVVSFDGNLREASERRAREVVDAFVGALHRHDRLSGMVWLKIDSATRGHIARETSLLLNALPAYRGAVVAPAYPANGRLFRNGMVVFKDETRETRSLRETFAQTSYHPEILADLSGDPEAVGARIDAAFSKGARVLLVDTGKQEDLEKLAGALLARRRDVLAVGSAGLMEAIGGRSGDVIPLPPQPLTCLYGTQSRVSREQLDRLAQQRETLRISRRPIEWHALQRTGFAAALTAASELRLPRIFDISPGSDETLSQSASHSFATVLAPYLKDLGLVLLSGGDTARAFFECLDVKFFDVVGVFEHGIPICRSSILPHPFLLKSGGFGDRDTLLRLIDFIGTSEIEQ